jgi:capsid protein
MAASKSLPTQALPTKSLPTPSQRKLAETEAWLDRLSDTVANQPIHPGRFSASEQRVRRWQGAQTTRINQGHWQNVSGQPINAELSSYLDTLRIRSEDEISKNSLIEGMISTYTLSCLGANGPTLQITSADPEYNLAREANWNAWAESAGSNQQLGINDVMRLWIRGLFGSGEFLDQFISLPDAPGPVKLRLLPIHPHRLLTPPEFLGDHGVAMGVRRDLQNRRPLCYYISEPYIMGAFEVYTGEFLEIPYRDLLHGFLMVEEDQVRGVPWLAPCLDAIGELRDYVDSTLDAARAAADWGVYMFSDHVDIPALGMGSSASSTSALPPDMAFQRQQERYVPPGWKPMQVSPQQPPRNWDMFYKSRVQEIGRCVNMPLMMMLLDSANHSYSSARFDGQLFWRGIGYVQGAILGRALDRIEEEVSREAELAYLAGDNRGLKPRPAGMVQRRWLWPVAPHVDPSKERQADRLALENGDTTYADLCARQNRDWVQVVAERKRINEALEAAGLPTIPGIPDPSKAAGAGAAGTQSQGSDDEETRPAGAGGLANGSANGFADQAHAQRMALLNGRGRLNGHNHGSPA